jgi:hypothetical protein
MMANLKTTDEIQSEVAKLRDLLPRVRRRSAFGDDNREAIQAQIDVLTGLMDLDAVDAAWGDSTADEYSDSLHQNAIDAFDWYSGLSDEPAPSEGWQVLACDGRQSSVNTETAAPIG